MGCYFHNETLTHVFLYPDAITSSWVSCSSSFYSAQAENNRMLRLAGIQSQPFPALVHLAVWLHKAQCFLFTDSRVQVADEQIDLKRGIDTKTLRLSANFSAISQERNDILRGGQTKNIESSKTTKTLKISEKKASSDT